MTAAAPEVDSLELLDFDHEVPCTLPLCTCEQTGQDRPPAAWRLYLTCGCTYLLCEPCKADADAWIACNDAFIDSRCRGCHALYVGLFRDHVASLERLT